MVKERARVSHKELGLDYEYDYSGGQSYPTFHFTQISLRKA